MLKYFSMFSGIGGFELAIQEIFPQAECVGYSEIDKNAIKIYEQHFPNHRNFGDATTIIPSEIPDFDFLCGGFPCQPFSGAGLRKGFDDTRGTLFFDVARIIKKKRPRHILLENVSGLLSHDEGRTFKVILSTLEELGYECEWLVFDSWAFNAAPRKRVYIKGTDRERPVNVGEGSLKTISAYAHSAERIANQNNIRNEELGRSASGIIRTFKQLPDWLHDWSIFYSEEARSGQRSNG